MKTQKMRRLISWSRAGMAGALLAAMVTVPTGAQANVLIITNNAPSAETFTPPSPLGYGVYTNVPAGGWVTNRVTSPASGGTGIRWVSTGWTLALTNGTPLSSGVSTQAIFQMTNDFTLTWKWTNMFQVSVQTNGIGDPDGFAVPSVTLTPSGGWYTNGQMVAFSADPAGLTYASFNWSGGISGGSLSSLSTNLAITSSMTVTGNFVGVYHLRLIPNPANGVQGVITLPVSVPPTMLSDLTYPAEYDSQMQVEIEAKGTNGYVFSSWSSVPGYGFAALDSTTESNTMMYFTPGVTNVRVRANFKQPNVVLTIISTNTSGVTVGDPQPTIANRTFANNALVSGVSNTSPFVISGDNNTRWKCTGYTSTGGGISPANGTATAITPFNITNNITLNWTWEPEYAITIDTVGGGAVTPNPSGPWYAKGTVVTLTPIPNAGNSFIGWSGATNGAASPLLLTMDGPKTIVATFGTPTVNLTITSTNSAGVNVGNAQPFDGGPFTMLKNSNITSSVTSPDLQDAASGVRYRVLGFTGTGSTPSPRAGGQTPLFSLTNDTTVSWNWTNQFLLTEKIIKLGSSPVSSDGSIQISPPGTPEGTNGFWYDSGVSVTCTPVAAVGSVFVSWSGDLSGSGTKIFQMTRKMDITATFRLLRVDEIPEDWLTRYGLDPLDPNIKNEDPDNDGLRNMQEYLITIATASNASAYVECSPINADSDGDGIDDGYEFYKIGGSASSTNALPGSQNNFLAVVNPFGVNGPDGNPDGDFHWNTSTGYKTDIGLTTGEEYVGPDGVPPGVYDTRSVPGVTKPVRALCKHLGEPLGSIYDIPSDDTGDQSSSDSTDSEIAGFNGKSGDGFDDGFEYSWDYWQSQNEDSATGDPLGHHVPFFHPQKPELPTAALLAPWFHSNATPLKTNDLAVTSYTYGRVNFFVNSGDGYLIPTNSVDLAPGAGPVAMALGTFSATNDIVIACSSNNSISVLLRAPSNEVPFTVTPYTVGIKPSFVAVGRFNNDAFDDIAVANSGDGTVSVLTNNGVGVFAALTNIFVGGNPSCVAAGYIYGTNGAPRDLLVADGLANVIVLSNNLNGTFSVAATIPVGAKPTSVVIADFNLDKFNDFAVCLSDGSVVKTYLGNGAGGFVFKGSSTTGASGYPVHLAVGDLNYSTDPMTGATTPTAPLDLIASAFSNQTGRPFLGLPTGAIDPAASVDLKMRPVWSVIGDVNGDKINDVIFVCRDDDKISIWTGDRSGSFSFFVNIAPSVRSSGRPFNPAVIHELPPGNGFPDYDLIYLPKGGVGDWFSDDLEYNAWSTNTIMYSLSSNVIVRQEYPNTPRCTHPFLWDADRDGMPDGWEVVFGYDPWKAISFGGAVTDANLNPDLDGHASAVMMTINAGVTNKFILNDNALYSYKCPYPNNDPYPPNGNTFANNFNPNTGWLDPTVRPLNPPGIVNTAPFVNRLEMLGGRLMPAVRPFDPADRSTNPKLRDTDGDGCWDGWELYVGLNPIDGTDAYLPDADGDGLVPWQEFMCLDTLLAEPSWTLSTNGTIQITGALTPEQQVLIGQRIKFVQGWQNKTRPTDPNNGDTDDDQIGDGAEQAPFNYSGGLGIPTLITETDDVGQVTALAVFAPGGGLSPTAVDTDNDWLPDYWEASYAGTLGTNGLPLGDGMDGTVPDALGDCDGDGLLNYQEYMVGAVYHWQWAYNNGGTSWTFGRGLYGYEPFDFFDDTQSWTPAHPNGDAMSGPGGRRPKPWDAHFWANKELLKPFNFITAAEPPRKPHYFSSTDPTSKDSDQDGMDDYYEVYHMLNPIRGQANGLPARELVLEKLVGVRPCPVWPLFPPDVINYPWVNGEPYLDSDQDGLPNIFESIQGNSPDPQFYHTDPSPYWMSDMSYEQSFANLYYWSGQQFGLNSWWYWDPVVLASLDFAPDYMFDFEMNEGFDTDNDNLSDRAELVDTSASPGSTDPLDSGDPIKHRALYLNGVAAAARTFGPTSVVAWNQLRSFTVEAWIRPQRPASGVEQVIVERPAFVGNGNSLGYPSGIRVNFRLGLDPSGRPFIGYHGAGYDPIFSEAKTDTSSVLPADQWTHLAGVYDGTAKKLILYANGIMVAMKSTAEIPYNGWLGGYPGNPLPVSYASVSTPIIIGARENNPPGWVDPLPMLVTGTAGIYAGGNPVPQLPAMDHYFKGWVDEVHIFDGAKPQAEVVNGMTQRWTLKEARSYNAASTKSLLYCYSFDDIQDPDYDDVAPAGFSLLTGYMPGYVGIPWWMYAPDKSLVYNDYRYVPWVENLTEHVPLNPSMDSRLVWDAVTNRFPNTSNPYTFCYVTSTRQFTQYHPFISGSPIGVGAGDLLPLRWAVADEDVVMWDHSNARLPYDTDGDGLPDDWEVAHGLDPRSSVGINGADGDPDGDGLSNFYEYLCGTDPWKWDSDGSGTSDADKDSDGDGLSNREELRLMTLPNDKDTDDDGVSDWEEVTGKTDPVYDASRPATSRRPTGITDPLNPLEPLIPRSMMFNGNARVLVPPSDKLMSKDWTIEMWVRPATNCNGGVLLSRYVRGLTPGQEGINYELGLSTNGMGAGLIRPYVKYSLITNSVEVQTRVDGLGANELTNSSQSVVIPLDKWTHLAGVHDSQTDYLALYVNGKLAASRGDATAVPPTVFGYTVSHRGDEITMGASRSVGAITNAYKGLIDEVRIWNNARSAAEIASFYNAPQTTGGQATSGKTYAALTAQEKATVDFTLEQTRQIAATGGNKYTVGYSPVLLRPSYQLCGFKNNPADFPAPDLTRMAPAASGPLTVPAVFSWVGKNGVTPIKDQGQCGACWAFASAGAFECALKIASGVDYDLSEQYLVSCNLDGWSCDGGLTAHKYHCNTPAADGQFGAVYEKDDPYLAVDKACDGPYPRPFVLKSWSFLGTGDSDLSISDATIKQAIYDHGPVMVAIYVGPAFQAYSGGIFNTSEVSPTGYGNHAVLLVGWDDSQGCWILRNQWGTSWGEAGYMRIAYGTSGVGQGASYVVVGAIAGEHAEYRFDDGGVSAQDFSVSKDWLTGWASAAILDGAVFWTNSTPLLDKDSDGDGLPDWWELGNGLDPYDATGVNGGAGDPDGDGLSNFAEYLAGTNPHKADTDGDGFNDYDSRPGPGYRTYGELYDDGDGIPDAWEVLYKGPCLTTGKRGLDPAYYDANLDPDEDGWSNYAEYMVRTDPLSATNYPLPAVAVHVRYMGRFGATLAEAMTTAIGTARVRLSFYHSPAMDGYPDATLVTSTEATTVTNFTTGHIHEGNNYVFGYLDVNGDGVYQPDTEPAGIAQFQPINLGWSDINNVEIGLTDTMPGYPRFSWPAIPNVDRYVITNAGPAGFTKTINAPRNYWHEGDWLSVGTYGASTGTVVMLISTNTWPAGYFTNVSVVIPPVTLATPSIYTPYDTVYVYARNEIEFMRDPNATGYRFQIALASNGTPVISTTNIVPYMDLNAVSKMALPIYAGDSYVPTGSNYASSVWTNGRYWSHVQAFTPSTSSSWSPWSAFNLNLQTPAVGGKSQINGDVYYFGKVSHGFGAGQNTRLTVIVQAFESPGFSGVADGQVQFSYQCNTNAPSAHKGDYSLMGLGTKPYYVRAFIDLNGNRIMDPWEPMGFAFESEGQGGYVPKKVDLSGAGSSAKSNVRIVIRDRDTDDDQLPDGWEWMYFGTLSKGAYDTASNTWTLLRNYEIEPADLDPTKDDYDGDGVKDAVEVDWTHARYGLQPDPAHVYNPYDPVLNPNGTDLNPTKWDTDGDGLSDGYEIAHGLNPLDPTDGAAQIAKARAAGEVIPGIPFVSQIAAVPPDAGQFSLTWQGQVGMSYEVQYSDNLKTWLPAVNGLRYGEMLQTYVDQSPRVNTRFYRVVVK